jgi:hypothetical protein
VERVESRVAFEWLNLVEKSGRKSVGSVRNPPRLGYFYANKIGDKSYKLRMHLVN